MPTRFFAGAGTVFPDFRQASIHKTVWSTGGGLRFLLFPKKDIFTRLDVAFTQEGSGFYRGSFLILTTYWPFYRSFPNDSHMKKLLLSPEYSSS